MTEAHTPGTTSHSEEPWPEAAPKDLELWLRARDEVERRLGRLPSNEDMVDFALSPAGWMIRHMFPFDDVEGSAKKHWIALAGAYTRKASIVFASSPSEAPTQIRALHIVRDEEGRKGIATLQQVVSSQKYSDQVLDDAMKMMVSFQSKYDALAQVIHNPRLVKAVRYAKKAVAALREEPKPRKR